MRSLATLRPATNQTIEARMRQIVAGVCLAHDVTARVSYETLFPSTINSDHLVDCAVEAASGLVGANSVDPDCLPKLFSEDFAHFASERAG